MFAEERQRSLCDLVAREGKLSVAELQKQLGASPATIRRDLAELEDRGEIVRVHGGVMHPSFFYGEPTFSQRRGEDPESKAKMAKLAASLVPERVSVYIDAGTSALEVGRELLRREDVTLFTHSLPFAILAPAGKARVICLGGEVRSPSLALVGALGLDWVDRLHFDYAFLGASGLTEADGAATTELSEAAIKQAVIKRTKYSFLVCGVAKWNHPGAVVFGGWRRFAGWVTDQRPPAAFRRRESGKLKILAPSGKKADLNE